MRYEGLDEWITKPIFPQASYSKKKHRILLLRVTNDNAWLMLSNKVLTVSWHDMFAYIVLIYE